MRYQTPPAATRFHPYTTGAALHYPPHLDKGCGCPQLVRGHGFYTMTSRMLPGVLLIPSPDRAGPGVISQTDSPGPISPRSLLL